MKKRPGDIIILHRCNINDNRIWFLRYQARWTELFVISDLFFALLPVPCNNLKNQYFEKMKTKLRDIIILHMFTTNDNHMIYGSWDMERDRGFFVIFNHFLHSYPHPLTTQKSKFWKNEKTTLRYYHFTHAYPK